MPYPYNDLRDYLAHLESADLLHRITGPIDKNRELVPLVRLQFRGLPAEQRKAFLFENVVSQDNGRFDGSVVIASFAASPEIYRHAVGASDIAEIPKVWGRAFGNPLPPIVVETGPCKENVLVGDALDGTAGVDGFPHPISTPGFDPAPFLTAGCWVTRDVEDGSYNVGTYRGMIKGPRTVGLQMDTPSQHIAIHLAKARNAGRRLEVAIVVGVVPAVALASVQKLPYGVSEYTVAGGLMGRPLEVVPAETVDLMVPAHAELVIEGTIDPTMLYPEGPFGEASGYLGPRTMSPVVDVTCITHRSDPVVQAFISEFPPSESTLMRKIGFESVYLRFLRESCNIASVRRVVFYEAASCNPFIVIQLANPTAGQSWQAMYAAAGYEPSMGKFIVAVDDDVNAEDLGALLWAISYHTQPARDFHILPGRVPRLDPAVTGEGAVASTMLIDATRSHPYPPTSLPAREYMEGAQELWRSLGLPALDLEPPWFGSEYGGWTDENRLEAEVATQAKYLETGIRLNELGRPWGSTQ